ncbi:MAG TPA: tetratricopeptide repeat protein [Anaerolineae bacterium]|nr:tetratricopeptide repeat protein [Anaerolineae bacterium]
MAEYPALEQTLTVYIPMDRRRALARGESLPTHTHGAALFADISGFTPLTEALTRSLGPRLGADELTRQLNRVYDALIAEVHRYGGSVIGFAGDAITCWFDDGTAVVRSGAATLRATACAFAMQQAMLQFKTVTLPDRETVSLAVKVSLASGPARRFLIGDPGIQQIDALAGETVARMAAAEHLAQRGDIIADPQTVAALGARVTVVEWRSAEEAGAETFAVLDSLTPLPETQGEAPPACQLLDTAIARPLLLPEVYEGLTTGAGEFLEMRQGVVALFLRFQGIDYDHDEQAETKLDTYIRWVQEIIAQYDGALLQLIIGDKGNYLYAAFGAPTAHENDPRRAVSAALDLLAQPTHLSFISPVQIGIGRGMMRAGAYGSATRRTYGVIGDAVNLSARLMQNAEPGSALVSQEVRESCAHDFTWQHLPPIHVKGKEEVIAIARPLRKQQTWGRSALYTGALVGRDEELTRLHEGLAPMSIGRFAGMIYIYGEAGVGKSRLIHELRQALQTEGVTSWFTCPADPILHQSLNPFRYFLRQYFAQNPESSEETNKANFTILLDALVNGLRERPTPVARELVLELERTRSILGALVDLHWRDSLYEQLEPELRFRNSLVAIKTLIQAESLRQPVVLHLEDLHWLDADSYELLTILTRNVSAYPFAVLLSGRYLDDGRRPTVTVDEGIPQCVLDLNTLPVSGVAALVGQLLGGSSSEELTHFLTEKTNGNPLFIEQLTLDLRERGLIQAADETWKLVGRDIDAVPATINAVLVARLDRLAAQVKAVVQTAAVLGREFEIQILSRMLHADETLPLKVQRAEEEMIWSALSQMHYIFRHTMMRDAAYDMQLQARLQSLHALAAEAMEQVYAAELDGHYADLAYHYSRAQDRAQAFHYARLAGEYAAARFANQEAMEYFLQALQNAAYLNPQETRAARQDIHLRLGELLITIGQYEAAQEHLDQALMLAQAQYDREGQARVYRWLARMFELRSAYPQALVWVEKGVRALAGRETVDAAELALIAGMIYSRQGDYDQAQVQGENALRIAQNLNELAALARAYNLLGHISRLRGQTTTAIEHFQRAFELHRQTENLHGQATMHNQIANAHFDLGQWGQADLHYREARLMFERIGDVYLCAVTDNNLGEIALYQGRLDEARNFYQQALGAMQQLGGATYVLGVLHMNLGHTLIRRGEIALAREQLHHGQAYFTQAEVRDFLPEMQRHFAEAALYAGELDEAESQAAQSLALARELEMRGEEGSALWVLGQIDTARQQYDSAKDYLQQSLAVLQEMGDDYGIARCHLSLAQLYHQQGEKSQVEAVLAECIPVFERLGAPLDLDIARSLKEL